MIRKTNLAKVVLLVLSITLLSRCSWFDSENEPLCRSCYATLSNGRVMEVEACSARDEAEFMSDYRNYSPTCR